MGLVPIPFLFISILGITRAVGANDPGNDTTLNSTEEHPSVSPAYSTHRLIPSVLDLTLPDSNSSNSTSSNNTTDDIPFLPSGMVSSYPSGQSYHEQRSNVENISDKKNFTPSYFIGEVIPEPYMPERFRHPGPSYSSRNNSNRSYQNPVSSQTALAFQKVLPFFEQIKQAALPPIEEPEPTDQYTYHHHAAPVHEPSMEDEDLTTPKYLINYKDEHQYSDRPSYSPYKFEGHRNVLSTKPITFEDTQIGQVIHHHHTNKHEGQYHHEKHKGTSHGYSALNGDQEGNYHKGHHNDHTDFTKTLKDLNSVASPSTFQNIPNNFDDYANAHSHHHHNQEPDFIYPPAFYPPEPADIPYGHLKEVHYKVYKQKPWGSLLPLAAALVPIGLLVAALNPSVLYVNSSQPMPPKHRSLDGLGELEGLEGLQLDVDCQKRAFCEAAVQGAKPQATAAQRSLWKLANSIPELYANSLGLGETLKAVKSNSCSTLKCTNSQQTSINTTTTS